MFELTQEQEDILTKVRTSDKNLLVKAYAGAGKSSTLGLIAEELKTLGKTGIYLSFNKALAEEAKKKFPSNVECMTTHSLAYRAMRPKLSPSASDFLDKTIKPITEGTGAEWFVLKILEKFCQSADKIPNVDHTYNAYIFENMPQELTDEAEDEWRNLLVELTIAVWETVKKSTEVTHDIYLKQYELSGMAPKGYDFVLFDEAQDSNEVTASIVKQMNCRKFIVGDDFQAIYEWRGAVNAMKMFEDSSDICYLSRSFRWGQSIGDHASLVLSSLFTGDEPKVSGDPSLTTKIEFKQSFPAKVDACIFRSNSALIDTLKEFNARGEKVKLKQGVASRLQTSITQLSQFRDNRIKKLWGFTSYTELLEQYEKDSMCISEGWVISIVENKAERSILSLLQECVGRRQGIEFLTGHASKGLEWDNVAVDVHSFNLATDELTRLYYVACTRAKKKLTLVVPGYTPDGYDAFLNGIAPAKAFKED